MHRIKNGWKTGNLQPTFILRTLMRKIGTLLIPYSYVLVDLISFCYCYACRGNDNFAYNEKIVNLI